MSNPYIATRSRAANNVKVDYGGEVPAPPHSPIPTIARLLATAVYDRAVAFFVSENMLTNVSARGIGESTGDVYDRFDAASKSLAAYLQLAFHPVSVDANGVAIPLGRRPVANAASASLATLLAQIPTTERLDETTARNNIDDALNQAFPFFPSTHPNWPADVDFWLRQILRDYEVVRIPMVIGPPSMSPSPTRNPAGGFLDLRKEVVVALCDVGLLRWGASDFGNAPSGDVQHFDTTAVSHSESGISAEIRIDLQTDAGVQQALASLRFDPGPIDGVVGGGTNQAVDAFRQARGLPPGGIDDDLRQELTTALHQAAVPF